MNLNVAEHQSVSAEDRPGHPIEVSTDDVIKIYDFVINDRRIKWIEISIVVKISIELVHTSNILHNDLSLKNLSVRWWVSRLLPVDQRDFACQLQICVC